ncbi:hypothetical protein Acsp05_44480 [Actinokineospora sp. NBRC 105648]|nr:hypothetical protein Acsp05_44480 [Actinokineospora sp. NBRC 105648]
MERKGQGKGIPTHGKFSGTLPPHEASPPDRASVTGLAYQRGRPNRYGLMGGGGALPLRCQLGDGILLCASGVDLSAAVGWWWREEGRTGWSAPPLACVL